METCLNKYKRIGLLNIHPNFDFIQTQKNEGFVQLKTNSLNVFSYFILHQKKNYDRVMKALDSITSIREMTQVSLKMFT